MLPSRILLRLLTGCALAALLAAPGSAQTSHRIAAVVNDDMISGYDLDARTGLVIFFARLQDTADVRRRIRGSVLRALIDERLKLQEARRGGIAVSPAEIDREFGDFARRQNLSRAALVKLLRDRGVPANTLAAQLRAEIAWVKFVSRRFAPRIRIGNEEIQEELDQFKARQGQTEYRLAEIVLAVDRPRDEARVREGAARLAGQVRRGARFAALARQFSQSATAAVGGDLGWIGRSALGEDLGAIVPGMERGAVSDPIRTANGYRIVRLVDRRKVAQPDEDDDIVSLRRLLLPLPAGAGKDAGGKLAARARTVFGGTDGCDDFERRARAAGAPAPSGVTRLALREMAAPLRRIVRGLKVGAASAPLTVREGGVMIVAVCAREAAGPAPGLPDRDEIADQLLERRLALMARRHLRDARLSAVIDVRG